MAVLSLELCKEVWIYKIYSERISKACMCNLELQQACSRHNRRHGAILVEVCFSTIPTQLTYNLVRKWKIYIFEFSILWKSVDIFGTIWLNRAFNNILRWWNSVRWYNYNTEMLQVGPKMQVFVRSNEIIWRIYNQNSVLRRGQYSSIVLHKTVRLYFCSSQRALFNCGNLVICSK